MFLVGMFAASAFFSAVETAIFSLTKLDKKRIAQSPSFLSKLVLYHLEHPRQTLATILIGNLVVQTVSASLVTSMAYHAFGPGSLTLVLIVFTALMIFFGEILPKTVAVRKNEALARWTALPLRVCVTLFAPFRWLVRKASDWILARLVPESKEHSEHISEEEIRTLVKIGEEEGVLDSQERYMLQKLLELGERPVKDIMTPRIEVAALNLEDSKDKHEEMIRKHHFSHFPVYQKNVDNLMGVISVQEYMLNRQAAVQNLIREPLYIPEVKRIDNLLAEFRAKNQNFAVCLDEYGGTAGIVTLEDILEEIFGEFYDEYAKVEHPVRSIGHNEFIVEAKMPLSDFNEYFSITLKSEDASTVGGFILEKIGELPEKGRVVKVPDCEFVIHEVIRHKKIRSVIVRPLA